MQNDPVPSEFYLGQNYPNPFKERTTIKYCVPHRCRVVLTIQNLDGLVVKHLANDDKSAGTYEVVFEQAGLPAGVYYCRMKANSFAATKEMLLISQNTRIQGG